MISYNPKNWIVGIFQFHKADTFRKLLWPMLVVALYCWAVAYVEMEYLKLSDKSSVKNIPLMHSLLGFAISMLLVFRTNTAYDRWWEGRKLWGALVNNSRNLAVKINSILPVSAQKDKDFFKQIIPLFAIQLKKHLQAETTRLELDELPHPEIPDFDHTRHLPNQIAGLMMKKTNELYKTGQISGDELITLNTELASFLDICGACERIKNTPIPYSYSSFLKKFIFIYVFSLPLGFVFSLGYVAIPVVVFIFYVLASLEVIAEEIEDPFGTDTNDLPMQKIAENIKRNVQDIFAG